MNMKKIALSVFILILALSVIAASVFPATASRIKKGQTVQFSVGRAGVSFTKSQFTGTVRLARTDPSGFGAVNHPKFKYPLLDVRMNKSNGEKVTFVLGAVYVYFLLRPSEVRDWEQGKLALFVYDSWGNQWKECFSFLVTNGDFRPRLVCRMRTFTVFGLAEKKLDN